MQIIDAGEWRRWVITTIQVQTIHKVDDMNALWVPAQWWNTTFYKFLAMVLHGSRAWSMQIIGAGVWCWWFITSNSKSVLFPVACFCFLVHVFGNSCGHVMIECNVSVTWLAPLSFTFASCCMFLDVLGVMWGCMVTSQEWNALFCNIFEPSCFFGLHSKEELLCLATFLWFLGFLGFLGDRRLPPRS